MVQKFIRTNLHICVVRRVGGSKLTIRTGRKLHKIGDKKAPKSESLHTPTLAQVPQRSGKESKRKQNDINESFDRVRTQLDQQRGC